MMWSVYGLSSAYLMVLGAWILGGFWVLRRLLIFRGKGRQSPRALRLANFCLSGWMLLAALTVAEIYFAFFFDCSDTFGITKSDQTWTQRHVVPETGTEGFRDVRPLSQFPASATRIWFLGDSFTLGHGVPRCSDRFSDRVAAGLERNWPGKYYVNNLGVVGTSLHESRDFLQLALKHEIAPPEVVVYVVCLNDVEPYLPNRNEYRAQLKAKLEAITPRFWLLRESFLLNFAWFRFVRWRQPIFGDYYNDLADAWAGVPGERFLKDIVETRRKFRRQKMELKVVVFPFIHNLGSKYPFTAAHGRIVNHCRDQGIPCLDLLAVFEPHQNEPLTANQIDVHPGKVAQVIAADAIEKFLKDEILAGTLTID